jgi:hypothetical protein
VRGQWLWHARNALPNTTAAGRGKKDTVAQGGKYPGLLADGQNFGAPFQPTEIMFIA